MGLERKISSQIGSGWRSQGLEPELIPSGTHESRFLMPDQRVTRMRESVPKFGRNGQSTRVNRFVGVYSAAAASESFGFAADIMKSEMRGTISDLKREPLKTP